MKECRWMKEVSIDNKGDLDEKYVETLKVWEMSVMKTKNNITVGCCEEQLSTGVSNPTLTRSSPDLSSSYV